MNKNSDENYYYNLDEIISKLQEELFNSLYWQKADQKTFDLIEMLEVIYVIYNVNLSKANCEYLLRMINTFEIHDEHYSSTYWWRLCPMYCSLFTLTKDVKYLNILFLNLDHHKMDLRRLVQDCLMFIIKDIEYGLLTRSFEKNIEHNHLYLSYHVALILCAKGDYWEKIHYLRYHLRKYSNSTDIMGTINDIKENLGYLDVSEFKDEFDIMRKTILNYLKKCNSKFSESFKDKLLSDFKKFAEDHVLGKNLLNASDLATLTR